MSERKNGWPLGYVESELKEPGLHLRVERSHRGLCVRLRSRDLQEGRNVSCGSLSDGGAWAVIGSSELFADIVARGIRSYQREQERNLRRGA